MKKCDIIIPVYNAYDSLVECVNSVIENTDLNNNGLILINDKSTDNKIQSYLKKIEKKYKEKNIKVINNEENLGFVGTVNKGMKLSTNDVLLLNSDTVVGKKWLEKISECAYSQKNVATVTPFSNNATLVSIPNLLEKNEIDDIDIDYYNKIFEKNSNGNFPEIPTGHGFCLFIKREVLKIVGYFDDKTFGKGYGEENDFCYRCLDYGYRHLLCDNTIVYHKESQSFKNKRNEVLEEHLKILEERYPIYCQKTKHWLKRMPIKNYSNKIYYGLKLLNKKTNVLILIHNWETKTGGTTLHVKDLISGLSDKYNFFVLSRSTLTENYTLSSIIDGEERLILLKKIFVHSKYSFYNEEYKNMINVILQDFNIKMIHIHHLQGHYFDILDVAKKMNIKVAITLHDFYCLCPTINMLELGNDCCLNKKQSEKKCKDCLKKQIALNNNIVEIWQKRWYDFLKKVDKIITPSENAKKYILDYYKDLKIDVIEHGIEMVKSDYRPNINKGVYNVAMIGVMCNHKGGNILLDVIKKSYGNIKFHTFGYSEIKELTKNRNNYKYHGLYKREDLLELLKENNIDLICFFQKWPETYSYTLNEAISAGIPVLSFDIGAGADRVKKYGFGWTVDLNSNTNEIVKKIESIFNDKKEYNEVIKKIDEYKIKTIKEMCSEYDEFYDINKIDFTYTFDKLDEIIFSETSEFEELNEIVNSTKWKLINKIKFPKSFVYFVRKVLKRGE
ncbi:MAG: glycosyltransferase [Bacilli bacterium]|nr:glycosyltransferase [Bacilli bacterium]